ncbi:ankyrin repeat domain-containing protein 1-like [Dendronephthya gigantea]|uniref:ankyrin repeat domain-containing protein 1-like n=1 Tax=Dendronephthya gigantea TaxID=151771 RepID=UPI00106BDD2C|nr:ankyrin repeat domain-containing protein 1-like [Dendronephthya gigantea]
MNRGADSYIDLARRTGRYSDGKVKAYKELMTQSMTGQASLVNEALHAVVENKLHRTALSESNSSVLERNRALLQYIATLAGSNKKNDHFNYEFVESLIAGGADINIADQHGQSMFHEVARSWNIDVARFLLEQGGNINIQDSFGRTPLHVAVSVDFADMAGYLLENHADIDARTLGELQAPIHYAAKNGAEKSLKLLLGYHADIDSLDYRQRTPLQTPLEIQPYQFLSTEYHNSRWKLSINSTVQT